MIIRWTDITDISKTNSFVFPDSIRVKTRDSKEVRNKFFYAKYIFVLIKYDKVFFFIFQHYFSMFLHKSETYSLMEQLINIAMKRLINDKSGFSEDRDLLNKLR